MTFNEAELLKIKKATSGWLKKSARRSISQAILAIKPRIDAAKNLDDIERQEALTDLMYKATNNECKKTGTSFWS